MSEGETESTNVDIAALLEALTGETTSECVEDAADYDTCKEEEEAMAAQKAALAAYISSESYETVEYVPAVVNLELDGIPPLECSMDGFVILTKAFIENLFILLSLAKETFAFALEAEP